MIYFAPYSEDGGRSVTFRALDGEACLGSCRMLIDANTADVAELVLTGGDAAIGEGLLRAAYNFAANKGAYWGVCSAKNAESSVARLRFDLVNGRPENDIPTLLTGTCGGHENK